MTEVAVKSRSRLKAVEPDNVEPKKPKVLVVGKPGVGKTWESLNFPKVYYMDHEGGADLDHYREKLKSAGGVYFGQEHGSLDIDEVIEQVKALATEKHEFRTLVSDSISKLWNTMLQDEQTKLGDKDVFGASKKGPIRKFNELLRWINKLDMNVVLISHSKPEWGKDDKGNREEIGETFDGPDKLGYELHLILTIVKNGPTRRAKIGKSRLIGFPEGDVIPWSYEEFAERYGRDVIERQSAPIILATPEQVAEMQRLLTLVKVPEDWQEKTFKKAEVESWAEMDSVKIAANIELLKGKVL